MDSREQVRVVMLGSRMGDDDFTIITTLDVVPMLPLVKENERQLLLKAPPRWGWGNCLEDCCTKRVYVTYYRCFGVVQKKDWDDCMIKKVCPSLSVWFDDESPGLPDGYRQSLPRCYVKDEEAMKVNQPCVWGRRKRRVELTNNLMEAYSVPQIYEVLHAGTRSEEYYNENE